MVRIAPPAIGARSILAFIFLARVIMLLMPNPPLRSPLKLLPPLFSMVMLNWFLAVFLEVKDDLYILSFHDAGQTGQAPNN